MSLKTLQPLIDAAFKFPPAVLSGFCPLSFETLAGGAKRNTGGGFGFTAVTFI